MNLGIWIGFLLLTIVLWYLRRSTRRSEIEKWISHENMPGELRNGWLLASEKDISCVEPVALNGRIDQAFLAEQGRVVFVDTKSRSSFRVYLSDKIQLSVYRVIWARTTGDPCADYGYIRVVDGKRVKYLRINLLSEGQIVWLWQHYHALRSNRIKAKSPEHDGFCGACHKKNQCELHAAKVLRTWNRSTT